METINNFDQTLEAVTLAMLFQLQYPLTLQCSFFFYGSTNNAYVSIGDAIDKDAPTKYYFSFGRDSSDREHNGQILDTLRHCLNFGFDNAEPCKEYTEYLSQKRARYEALKAEFEPATTA